MRRRNTPRKSKKLTPGVLFFVLGVGLIGSIIGNKSTVPPTTVPTPSDGATSLSSASSPPGTATEVAAVSSSPEPVAESHEEPTDVLRYVMGRKVALRDGPGKQFGIMDRYDAGREVNVLEEKGGWARVRDGLTLREGWMASSLLSTERPAAQPTPEYEDSKPDDKAKPQPQKPSAPRISDALIVQRIIAGSISMYSGSCACPYSTDRRGRRCGNRSAYSKPGGYAPVCFAGDVSAEMISSFRQAAD